MFLVVKDDGGVEVYRNRASLEKAGFEEADLEITEERWEGCGRYARLIGGEIVLGYTSEETEEINENIRVTAIDKQLDELAKKQERSTAEIVAALVEGREAPEESREFHLERHRRMEELREERKGGGHVE